MDDGYDDYDYEPEVSNHHHPHDRGYRDVFDGYDSGVHIDLSLGALAHPSSPPAISSSRSASTKIQELINSLQQEANRYVTVFWTMPRKKHSDMHLFLPHMFS